MAHVLLDTTVVIDFLRRRPGAGARIRRVQEQGDRVFVSAVSAEEASAGLRAHERELATEFFEGLEPAPLGVGEGRLAGWWRRSFREQGITLSQADCLIAAAAAGIGATLATGNPKDFPMGELRVEHWPVGE